MPESPEIVARREAAIDALADHIYETSILVRSIIDHMGKDAYAQSLKDAFAGTTVEERRALCNSMVANACQFAAEIMRVDHPNDPTAALYWEARVQLLTTPQPESPSPR